MARKLVVKRGGKLGAPPGTLLHIGRHKPEHAAIRLIRYDAEDLQESVITDPSRYRPAQVPGQVSWLNVDGVADAGVIQALGGQFQLHPLVLEDVLNTDQRPKVEEYPGYLYIVLRMLQFDRERQQIQSEQVSLVVGGDFGLAVQALGGQFQLHQLRLEDMPNTDQRPKVEEYPGYQYIVLRMLQFDRERQQIQSEQVSLVLGGDFVLSFQERAGDVFDGVRERLRTGRRIRFMRSDYLAYALLDAVVDHYRSEEHTSEL